MVWDGANYPVSISCPGTPPQCPGLFPSPPYIPDVSLSRDQSPVFTDHPAQSSVMCPDHCMRAQLDPSGQISYGRANVLLCCFYKPKHQAPVSTLPICRCVILDNQALFRSLRCSEFRFHSTIWIGSYRLLTGLCGFFVESSEVGPSPLVFHIIFSITQVGLDPCIFFASSCLL